MNRRDDIEDIAYIVYWSVKLDDNNDVNRIKFYQALDMLKVAKNEWPIHVAIKPSDLFMKRAKAHTKKWIGVNMNQVLLMLARIAIYTILTPIAQFHPTINPGKSHNNYSKVNGL